MGCLGQRGCLGGLPTHLAVLRARIIYGAPGQNTRVSSLSLLQGIFPTQGSNPGLPQCRWILYQLSHREAQEYWSE